MTSEPIRVLVVDDHPSLLWGLQKIIESAAPAMCLAGKASCRAEALRAAREASPDVILLDVDLGGESGIDCIAELKAAAPARVIILTGAADSEVRKRSVMAGACGFVHKSAAAQSIIEAIVHVHAGRLWLDSDDVADVLQSMGRSQGKPARERRCGEHLTPAEWRIVAAVLQHRSAPNKVIAGALHISGHTLRNHLASIYGKLGLRSRLDLVLYAREHPLQHPQALCGTAAVPAARSFPFLSVAR
jgi:two-component system, NarL family, nitrate/nitrite response regulator NarL